NVVEITMCNLLMVSPFIHSSVYELERGSISPAPSLSCLPKTMAGCPLSCCFNSRLPFKRHKRFIEVRDTEGAPQHSIKLLNISGPTVSPTVSLLPPSSEQLSGGSASLACLLTGYSPQGALVSWEVDGLEVSQGVVTSPEEEKEGLYRRSSTLTLSKAGWEQGELYTCRVSHFQHTQASPLRRSQCLEVKHTLTQNESPTNPVSLLPPSSEQLSGGSASLACLLTGYSPQGALVSWEVDGLEVSQGVVTSPEEEKEGLYRRSSTLTLSKAGWEQGELYTCRVSHFQHTQLPEPIHVTNTFAGPTVSPTVFLLPPSSEQLSGGSASLACLLTGYSPQGALVSWEVDGLEVSQGVVTSPEQEKEGLYRRSSTLTLSKAGWEQGELYTCRVSHFQHTQASPLRRSQCLG
uniref:Ig-like domain-containing protein n=1 Tax=Salmo trutta TaxID=8032 RepID=A0A674DRV8_SALTR